MTREQIKSAQELWQKLVAGAKEYEAREDKKPWFRMSPKTCNAVTHSRVLAANTNRNEVMLDGYRIIVDPSLADGKIERKAGIEL